MSYKLPSGFIIMAVMIGIIQCYEYHWKQNALRTVNAPKLRMEGKKLKSRIEELGDPGQEADHFEKRNSARAGSDSPAHPAFESPIDLDYLISHEEVNEEKRTLGMNTVKMSGFANLNLATKQFAQLNSGQKQQSSEGTDIYTQDTDMAYKGDDLDKASYRRSLGGMQSTPEYDFTDKETTARLNKIIHHPNGTPKPAADVHHTSVIFEVFDVEAYKKSKGKR